MRLEIPNLTKDPGVQATRKMSSSVVTIDPRGAAKLLERNIGNRSRNTKVEKTYAERMLRGAWVDGTSIHLASDGRLIDGQTRLYAQILADVSVTYVLVVNSPPELQHWLDQQRRRAQHQQLEMTRNVSNTPLVASIAKLAARQDAGITGWSIFNSNATNGLPAGYPDGDILVGYWDAWQDEISSAVSIILRLKRSIAVPPSVLGWVAFNAIRTADREDVEKFFDKLHTGEMLPSKSPMKIFRERYLRGDARDKGGPTRSQIAAELIKTWNAFREGREEVAPRRITVTSTDSFPRMPP